MSFKKAFAALLLASTTTSLTLADTDTQQFTVEVPVTIDVTAPAAPSPATKQADDNDVVFSNQQWTVVANDIEGSSITFEATPFLTTQGSKTANRNTKLDLSIVSQTGYSGNTGLWSVTTASDTTDYLGVGVNDKATVAAASTDAANAVFGLDVTFISGVHGTFASGTYTTTVTGTIAAN